MLDYNYFDRPPMGLRRSSDCIFGYDVALGKQALLGPNLKKNN